MSNGENVNFRTLADINLTDNMLDYNGESILLHDSGANDPNRIFIFTNARLREICQTTTHFQMDGTFKLAPRVYNNGLTSAGQLYTIHGKYQGVLIPLFYCLMVRRTAAEYRRVLEFIEQNVPSFNPKRVTIDMEHSVVEVINSEYPECVVSLCFFSLQTIDLEMDKREWDVFKIFRSILRLIQKKHPQCHLPRIHSSRRC